MREIIVHGGAMRGQSWVHCGYYLVLVGLHAAYLELLHNVLLNDVTGCEDVSGHGERKLALHKVVFKLQDKLLVFGIVVVLVLRVGPRGTGGGGGSRSWWWRCGELWSLAIFPLLGGEDLEDVVGKVLILVFIGGSGFPNLEDVRFDYLFYPAGWGVAQVKMWWRFASENHTGLRGGRGGLGSQPCVNTRFKSTPCSVKGNRLPIGEVNPVIDPGGTTGLNIVVEGGA